MKAKALLLFIFICSVFDIFECYGNILYENEIEDNNEINNMKKYKPDWKDLDTRPLPQWYDKAKVGIFLHWGVYSVPSFGSEWFWTNWKGGDEKINQFMKKNYKPGFTYQEFAPMLTAEFFSPDDWANLFKKSGAKYIVLTSKHHEGYTLFPSKRSFSWNSVEVGPKRDLVGELAKAVRKEGLKFGVYHSLYEWYNPIYLEDKAKNYKQNTYVNTKLWPDIKQLVNDYKPSLIWSDGDWEAYDVYWNSTSLLAWLYNNSPVKDEVVVNDRWGKDIPGHHGDFYNFGDRFNNETIHKARKLSALWSLETSLRGPEIKTFIRDLLDAPRDGTLINHKWESAFTIDTMSWGYRRTMKITEILTIDQILTNVVSAVSCGGNALIDVGPTKEGTISPIFQERLLALGQWLELNGEGIYDTSPWLHQKDSGNGKVWYTCTKAQYNAAYPTAKPARSDTIKAIYAVFLTWPTNNVLKIMDITPVLHSGNYQIELLGNPGSWLQWNINKGVTEIKLIDKATAKSEHAWTLKFTKK